MRRSDREFLRQLVEGDREFMRELLLRAERSERQHTAAIEGMIAELREHRGEWRAAHDAWWAEWRAAHEAWWAEWQADQEERRAEQRASREALFRMLDRLGPGGASA
jgi:hypothetical protein